MGHLTPPPLMGTDFGGEVRLSLLAWGQGACLKASALAWELGSGVAPMKRQVIVTALSYSALKRDFCFFSGGVPHRTLRTFNWRLL